MHYLSNTDQPILKTGRYTDKRTHRWVYVIQLALSGYTNQEIAELTGYQPASVSRILASDLSIKLRQTLLAGLDTQFASLYPLVIETIRDGLTHPDMRMRLDAADKWLRSHGKYRDTGQQQINITAEDVVLQILNQGQGQSQGMSATPNFNPNFNSNPNPNFNSNPNFNPTDER